MFVRRQHKERRPAERAGQDAGRSALVRLLKKRILTLIIGIAVVLAGAALDWFLGYEGGNAFHDPVSLIVGIAIGILAGRVFNIYRAIRILESALSDRATSGHAPRQRHTEGDDTRGLGGQSPDASYEHPLVAAAKQHPLFLPSRPGSERHIVHSARSDESGLTIYLPATEWNRIHLSQGGLQPGVTAQEGDVLDILSESPMPTAPLQRVFVNGVLLWEAPTQE